MQTSVVHIDRRQRILFVAILISLLFHIALLWLIENRQWLIIKTQPVLKSRPEELTFIFPENKPEIKQPDQSKAYEVVQNMNENEKIPDQSNLLSDRNSRARNPERINLVERNTPLSSGNIPLSNLSNASRSNAARSFIQKKFSSKALTGETSDSPQALAQEERIEQMSSSASDGSNQVLKQKHFSVEELGALSLSTYRWEWAPYINAMKNKLYRVWFAPAAYYELGLIHGYTVIQYTIDRKGNIVEAKTLQHEGHESLKISSEEAVKALFPFMPLPENFPDETLTITAKLIYPDLRGGR